MHIHILGICGTFMGSLALLARELGHTVTGSDTNVYPPMSTQLETAGVTILEGYKPEHLQPAPDLVVVGNAMKRGIEAVEYMLNEGLPYTSGPQFLSEQVLQHRHVLAVAGTHGKTTTTTMLAWILHYAGIDTGFLIGGVPVVNHKMSDGDEATNDAANKDNRLSKVFAHSSYLGADTVSEDDPKNDHHKTNKPYNDKKGYFVIEADEYDSAFFDKRSKFVHYRPTTAILNNLEFDHADIFADLNAIQTQFHHMIRMIPSNGQIIMPANTPNLETTLDKGCWTPVWRTAIAQKDINECQPQAIAELNSTDGSHFSVSLNVNSSDGNIAKGEVKWGMSGEHNVNNALVAVTAAYHVGVSVEKACEALSNFAGIKRRMELIATLERGGKTIQIFDDFAHHPTAIETTLQGAKNKLPDSHLWAVIEPRSNTMKLGIHKDTLAPSAAIADSVIWYEPKDLAWGLTDIINHATGKHDVTGDITADIKHQSQTASSISNRQVVNEQQVMSSTEDIIHHIIKQIINNDTAINTAKSHAIVIMSNGSFEGIHQRLINAFNEGI